MGAGGRTGGGHGTGSRSPDGQPHGRRGERRHRRRDPKPSRLALQRARGREDGDDERVHRCLVQRLHPESAGCGLVRHGPAATTLCRRDEREATPVWGEFMRLVYFGELAEEAMAAAGVPAGEAEQAPEDAVSGSPATEEEDRTLALLPVPERWPIEGLTSLEVDSETGLLASPWCPAGRPLHRVLPPGHRTLGGMRRYGTRPLAHPVAVVRPDICRGGFARNKSGAWVRRGGMQACGRGTAAPLPDSRR